MASLDRCGLPFHIASIKLRSGNTSFELEDRRRSRSSIATLWDTWRGSMPILEFVDCAYMSGRKERQ